MTCLRWIKVAFAVISTSLSTSAFAEDGKDCAPISEDAKRLTCYDLIYRVKQTVDRKSKWIVQEETSKIDDKMNVFVEVSSNDRLVGRLDNARLVFECREGKTAAYITFGGYFMSSAGSSGDVMYRIDKRPAAKMRMKESTDRESLGLWSASDAAPFAHEMFGAQSLYLQATPHSGSPVSAEFPIAGLEEALSPLQQACKWQTAAPKPMPAPTSKPIPSATVR